MTKNSSGFSGDRADADLTPQGSIGRRSALKRGSALAGAVSASWAAPVVFDSVSTPAAAAGTSKFDSSTPGTYPAVTIPANRAVDYVVCGGGGGGDAGRDAVCARPHGRRDEHVAAELGRLTQKDARVVVLGHLLRGGSPTSFDRLAALRFGTAAVRALEEGLSGVMVALAFPNVNYVSLEEVAGRMKAVPPDSDTLQTGRDLGISFGD